MITRLHKHANTSGQSSAVDKQNLSDPNIPSQVSSPPVPDRDGPVKSWFRPILVWSSSNSSIKQLLQGTPVLNRASEVGKVTGRAPRTPTRNGHPHEPEHTALPRRTAMKPKGKGLPRSTTDATDDIVNSNDEFEEPVISALGKRDRIGGPGKRTDATRDLSFEEAERPQKNRVSRTPLLAHPDRPDPQKTKAAGQNNVTSKASFLDYAYFLGLSSISQPSEATVVTRRRRQRN